LRPTRSPLPRHRVVGSCLSLGVRNPADDLFLGEYEPEPDVHSIS
jgi:hypothetical protein